MGATKLTISVPASLAEEVKAYGISPSLVCQPALRAAVEDVAADTDKIVLQTQDGLEAFWGTWVIDPDSDDAMTAEHHDEHGERVWDEEEHWGVAVTRAQHIVVYWRNAGLLRFVKGGLSQAVLPSDVRERAAEPGRTVDGAPPVIIEHRDW